MLLHRKRIFKAECLVKVWLYLFPPGTKIQACWQIPDLCASETQDVSAVGGAVPAADVSVQRGKDL